MVPVGPRAVASNVLASIHDGLHADVLHRLAPDDAGLRVATQLLEHQLDVVKPADRHLTPSERPSVVEALDLEAARRPRNELSQPDVVVTPEHCDVVAHAITFRVNVTPGNCSRHAFRRDLHCD